MKTKKLTFVLIALTISFSGIILTSCHSKHEVVSSSFIQKRKYTKGYHFDLSAFKKRSKIVEHAPINSDISQENESESVQAILSADNVAISEQENSNADFQSPKVSSKYFIKRAGYENVSINASLSTASAFVEEESVLSKGKIITKKINPNLHINESKRINGFAIASFCSVFLGLYPLSIIFGIIALHQIKRNPEESGQGLAIAGIALGVIGAIIGTLLIIAIFSW